MTTMNELSPEQLAQMSTEDTGPLTRNIIIAFTVLSFVCIVLRIFTRLRYQVMGCEDHIIILAMCLSIGSCVTQMFEIKEGDGKHAYFIPLANVELILKYLFWSILCYNLGLTCIKVSIILQYRRIFTVREIRLPLNISLGICIAWGIANFFISVFACVPVSAYWDLSEKPTARCLKDEHIWFTNVGFNIATDILVAVLPVRLIWSLQVPKMQRAALLGILTVGWFVCIVSILRLHTLVVLLHHPDDRTYYSAGPAWWSSIELNLGIVCASLPALKPLIVKILPAFSTRLATKGHRTFGYGRSSKVYGLGSKSASDNDLELSNKPVNSHAYSSKDPYEIKDGNIYVTQQLEQSVEEGRLSHSESQKDLVVNSASYSK